MDYFKHATAIVESSRIGRKTRIWAFAHILPQAVIGEECNICDHVFIENDVVIGDRVTVKCGVQLWDGIRLEDDVFVGPNATFTNDPFPRSKQYPPKFANTVVRQGASIGANATILPGITIGKSAMVGAGAVVTRDIPPHTIVHGNPARIVGYDSSRIEPREPEEIIRAKGQAGPVNVTGVQLIELPWIKDLRGDLSVAEIGKGLPFTPQRCFWIFDVPSKDVRGEHSHRTLEQFLICIRGSCSVAVDDGKNRAQVHLDSPNLGLYIPPRIWGIQYQFTQDAVLLVFASEKYDSAEYIRDYDEFLSLVSRS